MTPNASRNQGIAIIVILAVLSVLAILGIALARMMRVEREAAHALVDKVQSRMLAHAGIERAIGLLRKDFLANANPSTRDTWVYKANSVNTEAGVYANSLPGDVGHGIPVELSENPSYEAGTDERGLGYSGAIDVPGRSALQTYTLKILDTASQLYVNGGELGGPHDAGYNAKIARMLGYLAEELSLPYEVGRTIMENRPPGGYAVKGQMRAILDSKHGPGTFETIRDFITCHTWVDEKVLEVGAAPAWDLHALEGRFELRRQPRAPINVNTAPLPVLVAVLRDIPYSKIAAENIASEIIAYRASGVYFANMQRLFHFLHDREWGRYEETVRDVQGRQVRFVRHWPRLGIATTAGLGGLWAMGDPETMKLGLGETSTEICHTPSGYYEIQSLGTVRGPGDVIAQTKLTAVVRLHSRIRHTTQKDFEDARVEASHMRTYPEYEEDSGLISDKTGWLGLAPKDWRDANPATVTFRLPLDEQGPGQGSKDPDFIADDGSRTASPVAPFAMEEGLSIFQGSNLWAYGMVSDPGLAMPDGSRKQLRYDGYKKRPLVSGSLDFFFKPTPSRWGWWVPWGIRVLFFHRAVLSPTRSLTLEIYHIHAGAYDNRLVSAIRYFDRLDDDGSGFDAVPARGPFETVAQADFRLPVLRIVKEDGTVEGYTPEPPEPPPGQEPELLVAQSIAVAGWPNPYLQIGTAEHWQHVAVRWENVFDQVLYVQGLPLSGTVLTSTLTEPERDADGNPILAEDGHVKMQTREVLIAPNRYIGQSLESELHFGMFHKELTKRHDSFARRTNVPPFQSIHSYAEGVVDDLTITDDPDRFSTSVRYWLGSHGYEWYGAAIYKHHLELGGQLIGHFTYDKLAGLCGGPPGDRRPIELGSLYWNWTAGGREAMALVSYRLASDRVFEDVPWPDLAWMRPGPGTFFLLRTYGAYGADGNYWTLLAPSGTGVATGKTLRPGDSFQYRIDASIAGNFPFGDLAFQFMELTFATPVTIHEYEEELPGDSARLACLEIAKDYVKFCHPTNYYHFNKGRYTVLEIPDDALPVPDPYNPPPGAPSFQEPPIRFDTLPSLTGE